MFLFAFFMRILNIAMNTQSINLQKKYEKRIYGSFHGLWSFGGIAGVGFSTIMIAFDVNIKIHLLIVAIVTIITTLIFSKNLIPDDRSKTGNKLIFGKPDKQILMLGMIILFAAICEGGMFDWSGVYFKEVIKVEIFTAGYLIFMTCMALSRFISDYIIQKIGLKSMYTFSSVLITFGMTLAVLFPNFWMAMIGFSLVGFGTAAVVPMTFLLSGTSEKYSPGIALSIVVTYAMVGILLGPVIIGYIAHAINLRASFVLLTLAGLAILPVSRIYFKHFGSSSF
jgi:predicted MFS family arabinose efflux permease